MRDAIMFLGSWSYLVALIIGFGAPMSALAWVDSRTPDDPAVYRNGAGAGLLSLILGLVFSIILALIVAHYKNAPQPVPPRTAPPILASGSLPV